MKTKISLRHAVWLGLSLVSFTSFAENLSDSLSLLSSNLQKAPVWTYGEINGEQRIGNGLSIDNQGRLYTAAREGNVFGFTVFDTRLAEAPQKVKFVPFPLNHSSYLVGAPIINEKNNEVIFILNRGEVFIYDIKGDISKKYEGKVGSFLEDNQHRSGIASAALTENGEIIITAFEGELQKEEGVVYHLDSHGHVINRTLIGDGFYIVGMPNAPTLITAADNAFPAIFGIKANLETNPQHSRPVIYHPSKAALELWQPEICPNAGCDAPLMVDHQNRSYYPINFSNHSRLISIDPAGKTRVVFQNTGRDAAYPIAMISSQDSLFVLVKKTGKDNRVNFALVAIDSEMETDDPQQRILWTTDLPQHSDFSVTTPVLAENGMIFVANSGYLLAIDSKKHGLIRWQANLASTTTTATRHANEVTLDAQGRVYLSSCAQESFRDSLNCDLRVFNGDGFGLAKNVIAKARGDLANTGRVYTTSQQNPLVLKLIDLQHEVFLTPEGKVNFSFKVETNSSAIVTAKLHCDGVSADDCSGPNVIASVMTSPVMAKEIEMKYLHQLNARPGKYKLSVSARTQDGKETTKDYVIAVKPNVNLIAGNN